MSVKSRMKQAQTRFRQVSTRFLGDFDENELRNPNFVTVVELVWFSMKRFFKERPGQIIGSAFILIMLWGYHGNLELLRIILPTWRGPGSDTEVRPQILAGIPWDHELISYCVGAVLLFVIPCVIIRFGFKQSLRDYGLGFPPKERKNLALLTFLTLTGVSLIAFWRGAGNPEMQNTYPLFRGSFSSDGQFLLYELTYLPFFIAIEFIFRGYLLFGLASVRDDEIRGSNGGQPGKFYFHKYALLIQMLSYTAWHLGKPTPEVWGTILWGFAAGATAYACRSLWPIILSHWLLNVFLDAKILKLL